MRKATKRVARCASRWIERFLDVRLPLDFAGGRRAR